MSDLTASIARDVLSYDPLSGTFRRNAQPNRRVGSVSTNGYMQIKIGKQLYSAHRLAWLISYGKWPDDQLDHINGDRLDNRLSNLRLANQVLNSQNRKRRADNTSGFIGVTRASRSDAWCASIMHLGKRYHLGTFSTAELAGAAYKSAKAKFHAFAPDEARAAA